jgi:hypothetical protein
MADEYYYDIGSQIASDVLLQVRIDSVKQAQDGTGAEEKERHETQTYGTDAADWLARWDAGKTVWTVEMGGLGPGYEQCIHIACAEIVRWFIDQNADVTLWDNKEAAKPIFERMEKEVGFTLPVIKKLGLSGAQWGAALNLASLIYRQGPRAIMTDPHMKSRHILVCRVSPG